MKIGSLVECIDNTSFADLVKLKTPYTISEIWGENHFIGYYNGTPVYVKHPAIFLDEVKGGKNNKLGVELPFPMDRFKELMPPMSNELAELLKQPDYVTI